MMLTRIMSLRVRDIGPWSGDHEFAFHDGLTLLHGRNGIGKSTLALALIMTLAFTARSRKTKEAFLPLSGGAPLSSVTFAVGDDVFTIVKVWGDMNQSLLSKQGEAEPIAVGDLAEAKAAELAFGLPPQSGNFTRPVDEELRNRIAKSLATLIFHSQGDLIEALDMGGALGSIGLVVDEQELARALSKVAAAAKVEASVLQSSTNKNANGSLVEAKRELETLNARIEQAKVVVASLLQKQSLLLEKEALVPSDEDVEEGRGQARNLRERADDHQTKREAVRSQLEEARRVHAPPKERLDERRGLESERERATAAFAETREALAVAEAQATPLTEQFTTAEGQVASLNAQHANAKQWLAWDGRAATNELLERDVEGAKAAIQVRAEHQQTLAELESELQALQVPSEEDWREIRALRDAKVAHETQRSLDIQIVGELPEGTQFIADGEVVHEGAEASAVVTFSGTDGPIAHVRPVAGDAESLEEIERKLNALLDSFGVATLAEIRIRQDDQQRLKTQIEVTRAALSNCPPPEELEATIAQKTAALEHGLEAPLEARPEGDLAALIEAMQVRIEDAQDRLKKAEENLRTAREAQAGARALFTSAEKTLSKADSELSEHIKAFGPTGALIEAELIARKALDEARTIFAALDEAKALEEDALRSQADQITSRLDNLDQERLGIVRLQEQVASLRNHPDLEDLNDLEAKVVVKEAEVARLQLEHDAFKLLETSAQAAQAQAQAQSRSAVAERLDFLLGYIWGHGRDTTLNEDGSPGTVGGVPFDRESHGTREQYNLVMRIVLLELLKMNEEGEPVPLNAPLILDDALVFADQGRRERTRNLLRSKVDQQPGLQLIIFSCRPEDYLDIADAVIDLDMER